MLFLLLLFLCSFANFPFSEMLLTIHLSNRVSVHTCFHPSVHRCIQQVFTEYLLFVRYCSYALEMHKNSRQKFLSLYMFNVFCYTCIFQTFGSKFSALRNTIGKDFLSSSLRYLFSKSEDTFINTLHWSDSLAGSGVSWPQAISLPQCRAWYPSPLGITLSDFVMKKGSSVETGIG